MKTLLSILSLVTVITASANAEPLPVKQALSDDVMFTINAFKGCTHLIETALNRGFVVTSSAVYTGTEGEAASFELTFTKIENMTVYGAKVTANTLNGKTVGCTSSLSK